MSDERRALTDGPWLAAAPLRLSRGYLSALHEITSQTAATGHGPEDYPERWGDDATHVPGLDGEDPYGLMYGDWQDPFEHADDMCTGCTMCAPWEGRPYEQVRAERRAAVAARRARERDAAGS
jgi:hypothetical protein